MTLKKSVGMFLLGIWLIASGAKQIVSISFPYSGFILAVLAIAAGVFLVFGK